MSSEKRQKGWNLATAAGRAAVGYQKDFVFSPVGSRKDGVSLGYRRYRDGSEGFKGRIVGETYGKRQFVPLIATTYEDALRELLDAVPRVRAEADNARIAKRSGITMADLISDYLGYRRSHSEKDGANAEGRLEIVVRMIGKRAAASVREDDISRVVRAMGRREYRGRKITVATLTRDLHDVHAMLARADLHHGRDLPPGWLGDLRRGIKLACAEVAVELRQHHGRGERCEIERGILSERQIDDLVGRAMEIDSEFGRLVRAMRLGHRLSQVLRCRIRDLKGGTRPVLHVPVSRKGGTRVKARTHIAMPITMETWKVLHADGDGDAPLFSISADRFYRLWRDLAVGAAPYRLRDAAIIRAIMSGLDLVSIAKRFDTSVIMIERHYASAIESVREDQLRGLAA